MTKIVGIRFRTAGKIYYFDPADFDLDMAMHVIVETARGIEMGTVLIPPKEVDDDKVVSPLKPVIRVATDEDEKTVERNKEKEKEAFAICKEKIIKHGLEMKLVDAEYTFDGNKLLFYFTADGRIDFRELVKDLAAVFRTRIELRQIGVRDETKLLGGIGICGRPLCCLFLYIIDLILEYESVNIVCRLHIQHISVPHHNQVKIILHLKLVLSYLLYRCAQLVQIYVIEALYKRQC